MVSSEIVPFASTGGLGDVCASLPKALVELGVEVVRLMPLYEQIDREQFGIEPCNEELHVPLGHTWYIGRVWKQESDGITTYFIESEEFFDREGLYGGSGHGYADNFERFLFFQKAVVRLIDQWNMQPDMVHCNDWQTALIPMLLYHGIDDSFRNGSEKTLMTLHNVAHQGWAPAEKFYMTQLPESCYTMHTLEFYGEINTLKGGIVAADAVNTVSPTYAEEIKTPEFGCRLNGVLFHRRAVLHGILNGIDYTRWDPASDPHIETNYSRNDPAGKADCKRALQQEAGLRVDPGIPLVGMISRLVPQKGIDLLVLGIEQIAATGVQLVILGQGDERYEAACRKWAARWPEQICAWIDFDHGKAHRIEAGSDLFLMPSEFEPCGQNQLYSLRYGTVPVVNAIGGLEDSVVDFGEKGSSGFKFHEYSADALCRCLDRALAVYRNRSRWTALMKRGMKQDFSVIHMAKDYIELYTRIITGRETVD
jgi:starch synthase